MSESKDKTPLTETLAKTPPHGMKGELSDGSYLKPGHVLWTSVIVIAIVMVVLLIFGFLFWRRRRAKSLYTSPVWINDPSAWAQLRVLINSIVVPNPELDHGNHPNDREDKNVWSGFASEVSLCLRRGLEIRTGMPFAERTNEEIFNSLTSGELKLAILSDYELRQILMRLDQVRFGGAMMTNAEASAILTALRTWCDRLEQEGEKLLKNPFVEEKKSEPKDQEGSRNVFTS